VPDGPRTARPNTAASAKGAAVRRFVEGAGGGVVARAGVAVGAGNAAKQDVRDARQRQRVTGAVDRVIRDLTELM
jgi:hypothetical protein